MCIRYVRVKTIRSRERDWGHNKVADLLADDLARQIAMTPECWLGLGEQDDEFVVVSEESQ
jgi:hypothetical protein